VLVRGAEQLSADGIQQYWVASKCRLDRWTRTLRDVTADARQLNTQALHVQWPYVRSVLEEVLTGEVLTRVWAAVLCAHDRQHGRQEAEPIARSVMIGHLEVRHRVLMLLVRGPGIDADAAMKLNLLRRRIERWTDLLVGYLLGIGDVGEFAIDSQRAKDFSQDLHYQCNTPGGRHAWPLVLSSLRAAFRQGLAAVSPNADLNLRIASAILGCFPAELFDSTGMFRSLWMVRLFSAASDMQGMIDDLISLEQPATRQQAGGPASGLPDRWRRLGGR
jgi:hypothetical protein